MELTLILKEEEGDRHVPAKKNHCNLKYLWANRRWRNFTFAMHHHQRPTTTFMSLKVEHYHQHVFLQILDV